jgi:CheY-like chemotaxis protein
MELAPLITSPSGATDLASLTLLIIDDDAAVLDGLTELFEEEGYVVATAADGQAALHQLRSGLRPCVILLDLMMPGMNGWDFRQKQMDDDDLKDIPVIVMTAAALREAAVKAQLGNVDFVPKPASLPELLETVRRHCPDLTY